MMKRIFSVLLAALMLAGCLVITSFAAKSDIEFSTKGSAGKPDDMVTYEVYCDKNAGSYSACVEVLYDQNAFKLVSCENGTMWKKSQYTTSPLNSVKNGKGRFRYVAECNKPDEVNDATGLMFTLTFQILKTAVNGDNDITLSFPDNGNGWFFYAVDKNNDIDYVDLSVECTNQSVITVSGSDATAPVTDDSPDTKDNNGKDTDKNNGDSTTKAPVYAYVTDDNGKLVKDDKGNYETYEVKDTSKPIPQYVFNDKGEPETDDKGDYVTYYEEETSGDANIDSENSDSTTEKGTDKKDKAVKEAAPKTRIILIVSIVAVVIAAVIIIIVIYSSKKKDTNEASYDNDNTDGGAPAELSGSEDADEADKTDAPDENSDDE